MSTRSLLLVAVLAGYSAAVGAALWLTHSAPTSGAADLAAPTPVVSVPLANDPADIAPVSVPWAPPEVLPYFGDTGESLVATVSGSAIAAYADIDDSNPVEFFASPTQFGGPRVFLVSGIDDDWVQVYLPVRPNGTTGWVRRSEVALEVNPFRVEVNLSTSQVTAWDDHAVILQSTVAHGRPDRPTPLGTFFLRDIIVKESDSGPYGSHILALSGFSEVLETFGTGLPALALHGTNEPDLLGTQASSGCVRLNSAAIAALARTLPLGTPVHIVS